MTKHRNSEFYVFIPRQRTSPTKIAQSPATMFNQSIFVSPCDHFNQVLKPPSPDDVVPVEDAVRTDVPDGPNCLFDDAHVVGSQQLNEQRDSSLVDYTLALYGSSRSYVSERPSSLELKLRVIALLHVLNHPRHQPSIDHCLDGRTISYRQDLAHSDHAIVLPEDVTILDSHDKVPEYVHTEGRLQVTT